MGFIRNYVFSWQGINNNLAVKAIREFDSELVYIDDFNDNTGQLQHVLIVKTDLDGEPIWAKVLENAKRVYDIHKLPNGDYFILSGESGSSTDSPVFTRLDSDGNFLWSKKITTQYQRIAFGTPIIPIDSTSFVLAWSYKDVFKLDYDGNVIANLHIPQGGGRIEKIIKDGNTLLVSGYLNLTTNNQDPFTHFFIIQTDLNLNVTKKVDIENLLSEFPDGFTSSGSTIRQFERINDEYLILQEYRFSTGRKFITYKVPTSLNIGTSIVSKRILSLSDTTFITFTLDGQFAIMTNVNLDLIIVDFDFTNYFNLSLARNFGTPQTGSYILGVGDTTIYIKEYTGGAIGTIEKNLDFEYACFDSTQTQNTVSSEVITSELVDNTYFTFQSILPSTENLTTQVSDAIWTTSLLCSYDPNSIEKIRQDYFIKKYEDTFTENLELIGENNTSLFWTHRVVGSGGHVLLVTDRNFNPILVKNFNATEVSSPATLQKVISCSNGDVLILGNYLSNDSQLRGPFVIRLSEEGSIVWIKRYNTILGAIGNSAGMEIHNLNNGLYVLNNPRPAMLFTIDEQGLVVDVVDSSGGFPIVDSLVVYNQNVYACTRDGNNPNTGLFGLAKFDFSLSLLDFSEYHFDSNLGIVTGNRTAYIYQGNLIISANIKFNSTSEENIYLVKIDLSASLPNQLTAKVLSPNNYILFQLNQSSENFYIHHREQGTNNRFIYRFDSDLNFSNITKVSTDTRDFYVSSDALYFSLVGQQMLKTSQSFYSNCFTFENTAIPLLQEVVLLKDSTQNYTPSTLALQNFDFVLNVTDVSFTNFQELCALSPRIIQSPHLYLQAAGSTGGDGSASGIHLRWLLKKDLFNHLPKGNLATSTTNYNKSDDFVTIYRAPYSPVITSIDLLQPPKAVENRNAVWIYQVDGLSFFLYFRNKTKYNSVRNTYNPLTQTVQFIQNYGDEVLEFQTATNLFFAVKLATNLSSTAAKVETEILSVEGSTILAEKQLTARKTFTGNALLNARLLTENGKSLRFKPTNCIVTTIEIEIYSTLSDTIENGTGWTELGQFALSETDTDVFTRLEQTSDQVNGIWPRYNDDALVNIQNYKDKWNQQNPSTQSTIKQTVQDYISLSDAEDNPTALQAFSFDDNPTGATAEENTFELPNLMLLQQASMDFHVARMLGLGHLDVDSEVQNSDSFVYMAVYQTAVSLIDGQLEAEDTEHRYITVPTARTDEKLPTPIDLLTPVPGVYTASGIGENNEPLTDENGYTPDGKTRFVSLYAEEPEDLTQDQGFFNTTKEFNLALETSPVFAGIEYKKTGETDWRRPELANTPDYQNTAPSGQTPYNETVSLPIPDIGTTLFVHRERENGEHIYSSYGINWFSRIARSIVEHALTTTIVTNNALLPPSDRSALLIVEEQPLLLTTANEQQLLTNISGTDKTLVRLLFNYNTEQELLSYQVTERSLNGAISALDPDAIFPDAQEIFADEVEMYFRDSMPLNVTGRAVTVTDDSNNEILSVVTTTSYTLVSEQQDILPSISIGQMANFVGGVFVLEDQEYLIHGVTGDPDSPTFTIYKKQISDRLQNGDIPNPAEELTSPKIKADGMFLVVENLQNVSSWGSPNPHPLKVQIGDNWPVHREIINQINSDGVTEEYLQKTRGIWDNATIEHVVQPKAVVVDPDTGEQTITETEHRGQYKATFGSAMLANHPQNSEANPVQWYKGIIRVHSVGNPNGERRSLEVLKIENISSGTALVVYFKDKDFRNDPNHDEIQIGGSIQVNFYPGYRIHLFANSAAGLTAERILPETGEGIKYSCFGFRSLNNTSSYYSRIAVPTVMFAQEVIVPLVPQLPVGALYATRPDSFGKATYTFTTQFDHTPHGILYYRADDDAILSALYTTTTLVIVKQAIAESDQSFLANRWQNLLGFAYDYPTNSFQTDGLFGIYPETAEGYRLPNPDNPLLFIPSETPGSIMPGNMTDRIKTVVLENFVPLTEIPLLYEQINGEDYQPIPKKQVVRDRNGAVLSPLDPDFDIAPMAKKSGVNSIQFTDFTLDGTSDNLYFYSAKELGNTMQMSDFSPILGPIKLVNTNPPIRPAIRQVIPILENTLLGISPQIEVSVNAYPKVENIKKLRLYRALNPSDSLSIRTMLLVEEINLETADVLDENIWKITDGFGDIPEVPFGDPLYYRVTVSREIEYPDKDDDNIILTEYVPSEASKLVVTTIVENSNPISPELSFTSNPVNASNELENVVLSWEKTTYKAKYYLYKLNEQGQWLKIHELVSNENNISVPLDITDLGTGILPLDDISNNNQSIFHHFKVAVENTSGLLSQEDKILTIPSTN